MESIVPLILKTVVLRPYVFAFLMVYFVACSMHLGVKRAILFTAAGYLIAWFSEYSSIHTGIPYGHYSYVELTKGRELWFLGVPFMDSLSYVFLAYASFTVALVVISPLMRSGRGVVYLLETREIRDSLHARVLAAFFFVYLDIIIDPVALQGSRWFLGQIYSYPEKGVYFGVPISNFIGWFIVGYLMVWSFQKIDVWLHSAKVKDHAAHGSPGRYLIGPVLYVGVLIFNLSVTFLIGEYTMGWVGIFIVSLPLFLVYSVTKAKLSRGDSANDLEAHLRDFPRAVIPME